MRLSPFVLVLLLSVSCGSSVRFARAVGAPEKLQPTRASEVEVFVTPPIGKDYDALGVVWAYRCSNYEEGLGALRARAAAEGAHALVEVGPNVDWEASMDVEASKRDSGKPICPKGTAVRWK